MINTEENTATTSKTTTATDEPPTSLGTLFWEFAKVGLFTFGGGYAMIPIIDALCVSQHRWLTPEQMGQTIVIAESTPGPIAVNCATYVGFKQRRWIGALAATAGICLPSFIIIYLIALWFQDFLSYRPVVHALAGVNIAVGLLVLQAGIKMAHQQKTPLGLTLVILALTALLLGEMHILPLTCTAIMGGAVVISLGHYCLTGQATAERAQQKQTPPSSAQAYSKCDQGDGENRVGDTKCQRGDAEKLLGDAESLLDEAKTRQDGTESDQGKTTNAKGETR